MKSILGYVRNFVILLLIAIAVVWTMLAILEGAKDGIIGLKNYVVSIVTNDPVSRGLPDNLIESEVVAGICAESLEEQFPNNWYTDDLRRCVDRNNGYTDADGKVVHPFS